MKMNLDAGEHDSEPAELWRLFDIVAIACGGHAGDEASMERVIRACERQTIGAHPSYPDREGFGRATMAMPADAIASAVEQQCATLAAVAARLGRRVEWVKPHGALYHDAARSPEILDAVMRGARAALGDVGLIHSIARADLREGFADRAMLADGSLVPRSEPGALITDPTAAAAQAKQLARVVDTICVHADTPGALAIARAVRETLGDFEARR
jgi:UPF0271 protein